MKPSAKVIADSLSPSGQRLTTMQVTFHRFVLAEMNTHRVFSRNSASSRAIPVRKQLAMLEQSPAFPLEWASEKPGMQGGSELSGEDLVLAESLFNDVFLHTTTSIEKYLNNIDEKYSRLEPRYRREHSLHKSLINRLMEPFMWHTAIITSTEWDNFFRQRSSPLAQPEIRVPSDLMESALEDSVPSQLELGEWHLPYIDDEDRSRVKHHFIDKASVKPSDYSASKIVSYRLRQVSTARCARVSYLTHDGVRDIVEDINLYWKLISAEPPHYSPLEHVARPANPGEKVVGNFQDFIQLRHDIESQ